MGRVWSVFFYAWSRFAKDKKEEKLNLAICKISHVFKTCLNDLLKDAKSYEKYLEMMSLGVPLKEEDYHPARKKITSWNKATYPFIKKYFFKGIPLESEIFTKTFSVSKDQNDLMQTLTQYQNIIDLEGLLHEPLPLKLFKKISLAKDPLSKGEENLIKKWIAFTNEKEHSLQIRPFHIALKAFTHIANIPSGEAPLEFTLATLGLKVFMQKDPHLIKWRESLKPGSILKTAHGKVTLKDSLSTGKKKENDNNLLFTIEEDPQKIVSIGINQSVQGIKKHFQKTHGAVIRAAKCLEIVHSGNFALFERLVNPIGSVQWSSQNDKITKEDLPILVSLIKFFYWMIKNSSSPQNLNPDHLLFDDQGNLKYAKVCVHQEFSHTLLEDFILHCAKNNKTVFSFLMGRSGLHSLPTQQFYQTMVKLALEDNYVRASDLAAKEEISDPKIVDRGDLLFKQTRIMKEHCKNTILEKYHVSNLSKLEKRIAKELWDYYVEAKLSGTLWPRMENNLISRCVEKEQLKKRESV